MRPVEEADFVAHELLQSLDAEALLRVFTVGCRRLRCFDTCRRRCWHDERRLLSHIYTKQNSHLTSRTVNPATKLTAI